MQDTAILEGAWAENEVGTAPDVAPAPELALPRRGRAPASCLAVRIAPGLFSTVEWLFGLVALLVGLSTLAALPVVQSLSLGYFLESSTRVARTRRLRDGFIGVRRAARVQGVAADLWLATVSAWPIGTLAQSAELIDPGVLAARALFVREGDIPKSP
jgi:hypothetical protein